MKIFISNRYESTIQSNQTHNFIVHDRWKGKSFRFKIIGALTLLIITGTILPSMANIRGPKMMRFQGSKAIKKTNGVVVSEKLTFECDPPITAKHKKLLGYYPVRPYFVKVTAIYIIMSDANCSFATSFVMPAPTPITVQINDRYVNTGTPVKISRPEREPDQFVRSDNRLYEVAFSGRLSKGLNTIMVRYRQPMSMREVDYGYFTTSRFHTYFTYELWPLKEWNLSKEFRLDITVSTNDDTGFRKSILGSGYRIKLYGDNKGDSVTDLVEHEYKWNHQSTIKTSVLDTPRDILTVTSSTGAGFPDVLTVVMGQTRDMD